MSALYKWKAKPARKPTTPGDIRIANRFLLIPVCLHGEYRWIGFQKIRQRAYIGKEFMAGSPVIFNVIKWANVAFVDDDDEPDYENEN